MGTVRTLADDDEHDYDVRGNYFSEGLAIERAEWSQASNT